MKALKDLEKYIEEIRGKLQEATNAITFLQKKLNELDFKKLSYPNDFSDDLYKQRRTFKDRTMINDLKFPLSRGVYSTDAYALVGKKRGEPSLHVGWMLGFDFLLFVSKTE